MVVRGKPSSSFYALGIGLAFTDGIGEVVVTVL